MKAALSLIFYFELLPPDPHVQKKNHVRVVSLQQSDCTSAHATPCAINLFFTCDDDVSTNFVGVVTVPWAHRHIRDDSSHKCTQLTYSGGGGIVLV